MFTGLVEEVGEIVEAREDGGALLLTVRGGVVLDGLKIDDSVAIDGCCQTVVAVDGDRFSVVAVEETLKKTTFGTFAAGRRVNLERALRVGDRLGGHFVQGHVDCVGSVRETSTLESSWIYWIDYPVRFEPLVIPVGSIAINGVSLTAAEVAGSSCMVSIFPHTHQATTFDTLAAGDPVNVEFDMIGKYIRNFHRVDGTSS